MGALFLYESFYLQNQSVSYYIEKYFQFSTCRIIQLAILAQSNRKHMKIEAINALIVAARQTGWIRGELAKASYNKDYPRCIEILEFLISTYTHNEFNTACYQWIYEWQKELDKYETLQLKRTAR